LRRGRYHRAEILFGRALPLRQEAGDPRGYGTTLANLGHVTLRRGDVDGAAAVFAESLAGFQVLRRPRGVAQCLTGLAGVAAARHDLLRAARLLGAVRELLEPLGDRLDSSDRAEFDRHEATVRARLGPVAFARAHDEGRALPPAQALAIAARSGPATPAERPVSGSSLAACEEKEYIQSLTPREREVAALVARGHSDPEIARVLGISAHTAENHVKHIRTKLGARSRARIAAWATANGLTTP
jgi:DNA-binding CsgD family transcriptional regulator